jgi:hypothetical protein
VAENKLVGLLFKAGNDIDRAVADLSRVEATPRPGGGSSFAWTFAHVANQVDVRINVSFQGRVLHLLIGQDRSRIGGTGATDSTTSRKEVRSVF